jgi:hypothetical protein
MKDAIMLVTPKIIPLKKGDRIKVEKINDDFYTTVANGIPWKIKKSQIKMAVK